MLGLRRPITENRRDPLSAGFSCEPGRPSGIDDIKSLLSYKDLLGVLIGWSSLDECLVPVSDSEQVVLRIYRPEANAKSVTTPPAHQFPWRRCALFFSFKEALGTLIFQPLQARSLTSSAMMMPRFERYRSYQTSITAALPSIASQPRSKTAGRRLTTCVLTHRCSIRIESRWAVSLLEDISLRSLVSARGIGVSRAFVHVSWRYV